MVPLGWGTALKPALEPITVARKPLIGTVAENVLQHGTGAINVDGCRVGDTVETWPKSRSFRSGISSGYTEGIEKGATQATGEAPAGRWPANLIHDGSDEVLNAFPDSNGSGPARTLKRGERSDGWGMAGEPGQLRDAGNGSAARFFYCAKASKKDRDEGLEEFAPVRRTDGRNTEHHVPNLRTTERANHHPTVKPTDLMRYLCRLVTPPGGLVLDPFTGSGSTGKAAALEGFKFLGFEREAEYVAIARARIDATVNNR